MRRIQRLVILALGFALVVAGGAALPAVAASTPGPLAPYDAFTVYAGPGVSTSRGMAKGSQVFDSSSSTMTSPTSRDDFHIRSSAAGRSASMDVYPPSGGAFVAGTTYPTASVQDSSHAAVSFAIPGATCGYGAYGSGSVTVHEIVKDPSSGVITHFAATWDTVCPGNTAVFNGEIRWHSTLGYAAVQTSGVPVNGLVSLGEVPAHTSTAPVTISYASSGSEPVAVRPPTLKGPDAGSFVITGSTCTGQILAHGEACTVSVLARPARVGGQVAELLTTSDLGGDAIAIPLGVYGTRNVAGMYSPLTPERILDTRVGLGAPKAPLGAGRTLRLQVGGVGGVLGAGGVPAKGVGAVVLNLTGMAPTADTFLTTYASPQPRPSTSSINLRKGATVANMVTVPLSDLGSLDIYNSAGSTHVTADVMGYYAGDPSLSPPELWDPSDFHPISARRLLDTRTGSRTPAQGYGVTTVSADFGKATNLHVGSLAVNITVTAPQKPGHLVAFDGVGYTPSASTLNFTPGATVSNMSLVHTGRSATGVPTFKVINDSAGTIHLVVDVFGYYLSGDQPGGLHFRPTPPVRIVDTRIGQGATRLGAASTATITMPSALVEPGTRALVTNTTLVAPTKSTFLTLWPTVVGPRPVVSNVNALVGKTVAAATVTSIGSGGKFNVYNNIGATHALVDVTGTFEAYPSP
jgi:hypothetical protein